MSDPSLDRRRLAALMRHHGMPAILLDLHGRPIAAQGEWAAAVLGDQAMRGRLTDRIRAGLQNDLAVAVPGLRLCLLQGERGQPPLGWLATPAEPAQARTGAMPRVPASAGAKLSEEDEDESWPDHWGGPR
ncbi:hypothetical protein [Geminicoccus flavidas]|uniref:hypothetical protein n=1 Tax=Geminicoccus flavidas TaxID=2506407 RepID=UPI00135B4931|nr:hypothetical protein [Geminicoccus flavidas]